MRNHDEEMESYLKEFRPRAIRPLEQEPESPTVWLRRLAAVAAIVLAGGLSIWFSRRETTTVPQEASDPQPLLSIEFGPKVMNTFLLTKLALEDTKTFSAVLTEESRGVLPSLQGHESTLRILAEE
ncbi:MAG: hypothetical protein DMG50_15210 [Acidobacteria bacterium]|nr:MAG: hypothetical protein DMG50_15210 [Acidobacteriota bacterium]